MYLRIEGVSMFGEILDIYDNYVVLENKTGVIDSNYLNIHVIFNDNDRKVVGEIISMEAILGICTQTSIIIFFCFSSILNSWIVTCPFGFIVPDPCNNAAPSFPAPVIKAIPLFINIESKNSSNMLVPLWLPLLVPKGKYIIILWDIFKPYVAVPQSGWLFRLYLWGKHKPFACYVKIK